ncbi:rhomboid family intramembrane serine protease [Flavobacterium magnum]|uniref:Rhomboid family intramembrane serine protease n=1 Tax=Flavobacterium magnum TaxID=2162713 RepID=A0A2S0RBX2_9FLAO|nr:rhomboid family intramembrane serine protease [Flavobacterium magnum]AWA28718.1 rhomboid family intramembrane serine protease [Flavobacterium magnum]
MKDNYFKFSLSVIALPLFSVLLLWIVFWANAKFGLHLRDYGIYPRTFEGLRGILFSPFLHGDISHLFNNSIPLFILLAALRYFYRELTFRVIGYGILVSGMLTWMIARDAFHIGASSLIYVLVSFIFFKGIRTGYYRLVALSMMVVLIYGSLIWFVFPGVDETISWEGHLSGLLTGFAFSVIYKTPDYQKEIRYEWEKPEYDASADKFMQRFDENGNFVNPPPPEPEPEVFPGYIFVYDFIPETKEEKPEDNQAR